MGKGTRVGHRTLCRTMQADSKKPELRRFREIYREICRRRENVGKGRREEQREDDGSVPENIVDMIFGRNVDSDGEDDEGEEEYFVVTGDGGSTTTGSSLTAMEAI